MLKALRALSAAPPRWTDALLVATLGLALRLIVVAWAASTFPPVDDGRFYQVVAQRIAAGDGYTWLWPDGVVTYAAHYPVGYPALLGGAYALFGSAPAVAMIVNAVLGAAGVVGAHRLAARSSGRLGALLAASFVALHPGLVFYTPALMTEGVAAALAVLGGWACTSVASRGWRWLVVPGLALGGLVLIRPQLLLAVPLLGLLAAPASAAWKHRALRAASVTLVAVAVCAPWTVRNCARLESCVFVSANGGWNLFIGTAPEGRGGWVALETIGVPEECKTVFAEAAKDHCFGRAGLRRILAAPVRWLALAPRKLMMTFEYSGAAAYYLNASNGAAFGDDAKTSLGAVETIYQRVLTVLALLGLARLPGPRARARRGLGILGSVGLFLPLAWVSHLVLCLSAALLGSASLRHPAALAAAALVATTAATHAVFFGAGRYGLVVFAVVAALAGLAAGCRAESARGEA